MKRQFNNLILTLFFFLTACGGEKNTLPPGKENPDKYRGTFISSQLIGTKNGTFLIPYSVKAYKITYYTIGIDGDKTKASGLLSIPQKDFGEKKSIN